MPKSRAAVVFFIALCLFCSRAGDAKAASGSAMPRLVDLVRAVSTNVPVRVATGDVLFEQTDLISDASVLIRKSIEADLSKSDAVRLVTRERLDELLSEGRLQSIQDLVTPGTGVAKVRVDGVEVVILGRYFRIGDRLRIAADVVSLDGAVKKTATWDVPRSEYGRIALPGSYSDAALGVPPGTVDLVRDLDATSAKIPSDFQVQIEPIGGDRAFRIGSTVAFRVRSNRDCFIAVFVHMVDGKTACLFPNDGNRDTWLPANRWIDIPGTQRPGFEIVAVPPAGSDVVQVLACSSREELEARLRTIGAWDPSGFASATRGLMAKSVYSDFSDRSVQWAEDRIQILVHE